MAASPRGKGGGATLATCLDEARAGQARPVYLFDGDAFLSGRAARELAHALVPEAQRSLNLVELDAAASPAEVAAELSTFGLFGGGKVVLLSEPTFLTSKEDQGEAFRNALDKWKKGGQREAARRLLALAAKAGWSAEELAGDEAPGAGEWQRELSVELDAEGAEFVRAAARWAVERELKVARDDASALDALLQRGLPAGHVLVVGAGKVDGRLPLVKKLAAAGRRVTFQIEKVGTWQNERLDLGPVIESLLATLVLPGQAAKAVDRGAEELLAERVGDDARTLASELQKLVSFVGDRKVIRAADVGQVVVRVAEDKFFALGNAVEGRNLPETLAVLDRTLADGGSVHMVISLLASTVRRMIEERERARRVAGERRIADAREWERLVWPTVGEEERGEKKPYGFWMKYQAAQKFGRDELLRAQCRLAEADLFAKSGRDARAAVERLLLDLLGERDMRGVA
ncbi:MAG: DNA polymerase III subunit delta [Deltaproteobacteria bacterium]|nr:DNA polymerase III subunit delta [Deltaproteobacteria bacterium]